MLLGNVFHAFKELKQETDEDKMIEGKLEMRTQQTREFIEESEIVNSDYNFFPNHIGISNTTNTTDKMKARIQYVSESG